MTLDSMGIKMLIFRQLEARVLKRIDAAVLESWKGGKIENGAVLGGFELRNLCIIKIGIDLSEYQAMLVKCFKLIYPQ